MMKPTLLSLLFMFCLCAVADAQQPIDLTFNVAVSFQPSPRAIILSWDSISGATTITVKRKLKTDAGWTKTFALAGTAVSLVDTAIIANTGYEYSVAANSTPAKTAYLYAGKDIPAVHHRGKVILLVDDAYVPSLDAGIKQLIMDLRGDGWQVIRHNISRSDSVPVVKSIIHGDYLTDPSNVKALFLLGHIPVPYSGNLNPDGPPDHLGAWGDDSYYADFTGTYTDATVNSSTAGNARNWNVPGDGKFDQTLIPGTVVLETGRVDLYNLPSINANDTLLMERYLAKDHAFRTKLLNPARAAIVDDNFGYFSGEAFAADGWRNFSALLGDTSVVKAGDYFTDMQSKSYLWSYGCGGGTFTSCGGVGSTTDFAADSVQNIFTILFGSYFGDWDSQDNFLRAPLASSGWTLTNCWGGRPYWLFHHTGLGETVGFSAKITQNNSSTYLNNYGGKYVHIALMGDPTLRIHVVAPVSNLTVTAINGNKYAQLNWTACADSVLGYFIYRAATVTDSFALITPAFVTATTFVDSFPVPGNEVYMVRAVKLENTVTGSYFNLSEGIVDSAILTTEIIITAAKNVKVELFPNPFTTSATIKINAGSFNGSLELFITDVVGREVRRLHLNYSSNDKGWAEATIERDELKNGLYFYQIIGNTSTQNTEIISMGKLIAQ